MEGRACKEEDKKEKGGGGGKSEERKERRKEGTQAPNLDSLCEIQSIWLAFAENRHQSMSSC